MHAIETLAARPREADFAALCALLRDAIEGGASVGYLLPVRDEEMVGFWQACGDDAARGRRLILVARAAGRIVGSVQLEFALRPNSRHRAELQKLLVLQSQRGRGLGTALVHAAEAAALAHGRTLIVLDTSATGHAINLYSRCGYSRCGVIPGYAQDPDGPLIDTVVFYKHLEVTPHRGGERERAAGVPLAHAAAQQNDRAPAAS